MKKIGVFLITFMLFGCFSPASKFYQPIYVKKQNVSYNEFKGAVLLYPVLLPAEISKPQIVTLGKEDYEVRIDEFNRWASQIEKMIQRVINNNLGLIFNNARIENQSTLRKDYKYAINIEIQELSGRLDEKATVKASYFIRNKSGKILKSNNFYEVVAISGDYDAYVPAISDILGNLSKNIAKDIIEIK
jgi:uncharacterized lipoprotein YmbA